MSRTLELLVRLLPPAFRDDFRVPEYCSGAATLQIKVWLGQAGTVTPLHRDVPHNLNVHLTGRKRWLLFAPGESRRLHPRGLFSGMPNFASTCARPMSDTHANPKPPPSTAPSHTAITTQGSACTLRSMVPKLRL